MLEYGFFEIDKITLDGPSCSNCAFFGTDSNCEPECFLKKHSPERYEEFKGKKATAGMTSSPSIGLCAAWMEDERRKELFEKLPFTFSEDKKVLIETDEDFLEEGKYLIIPYGTEIIKSDAFSNMGNLEKVFIPRSVKEIESGAFCDCRKLKEIEIPDSVETLGSGVFFGCSGLKTVIFKNFEGNFSTRKGLTTLPYCTFGYCRSLSKILLPKNLTVIENDAFMGCTALKTLKLPESVTTIKNHVLRWTESLSKVNVPSSLLTLEEGSFVNSPLSKECFSEWKEKFPDFKIEIDESEE